MAVAAQAGEKPGRRSAGLDERLRCWTRWPEGLVLLHRPEAAWLCFLLSGHSHIAGDRRYGPTRRINPAAVHQADEISVALLDLKTDDLQLLTVPR